MINIIKFGQISASAAPSSAPRGAMMIEKKNINKESDVTADLYMNNNDSSTTDLNKTIKHIEDFHNTHNSSFKHSTVKVDDLDALFPDVSKAVYNNDEMEIESTSTTIMSLSQQEINNIMSLKNNHPTATQCTTLFAPS